MTPFTRQQTRRDCAPCGGAWHCRGKRGGDRCTCPRRSVRRGGRVSGACDALDGGQRGVRWAQASVRVECQQENSRRETQSCSSVKINRRRRPKPVRKWEPEGVFRASAASPPEAWGLRATVGHGLAGGSGKDALVSQEGMSFPSHASVHPGPFLQP